MARTEIDRGREAVFAQLDGLDGSRPPDRSAPAWRPSYAALDLGTNNCRLLVAEAGEGGGFRVVDAFSRIVRLGEGVAASGRLSERAMARTIDALRVCATKIRRRRVAGARTVATEACRRAVNCEDFLQRVEASTGLALEIISSREEARLSLAGCSALLDPGIPRAIVFDIGGGSTELSWVDLTSGGPVTEASISLPLGVVTLGERHPAEAMDADTYHLMVAEIGQHLTQFDAAHGIAAKVELGRTQMLGSSGTVTTLAGIHLGLPRYDRTQVDGYTLGFEAIREVTSRLLALDVAGRARQPCVGRDRADLVMAGCAILEAICRRWPVGCVRVADRGVREGILISLIGEARSRVV
ncbi:MAG: Ppx/GppA family phosphatase [Proteobacteria bacterium]|nr:Ppx/GppA family phosphatase [Pseudomonadota bacterium]MBI3498322.1 Ppx/GppA family phosphatase [Pseudomonadota bacterium]